MPDLNWENEETRRAIYDSAMRFWLERGVDGFRIDCVNMYSKRVNFEDAPIVDAGVFEQPAWTEYANGPRMHEFLREMNEQVLSKYDTVTVGELPHTPDPRHVLQYVDARDKQLSMVFQFDIVDIGQGPRNKYNFQPWTLPQLKATVAKWQQFIEGTDGWTTAFCENHDQGRSVSRFASDAPEHRVRSAKLLATMLAALTGTLFIYQGQEIGMVNVPTSWSIDDDYKDIESVNFYHATVQRVQETLADDPAAMQREIDYVKRSIQLLGRDNARTPMQWDASNASAGFTDNPAGAWMRTHDLYREINVARQQREPGSVLNFWTALLRLRKAHADLFIYGNFRLYDPDNEATFVFAKTTAPAGTPATAPGQTAVVALNFTGEVHAVGLPPSDEVGNLRLEMGNYDDAAEAEAAGEQQRSLRPWEARLYISAET